MWSSRVTWLLNFESCNWTMQEENRHTGLLSEESYFWTCFVCICQKGHWKSLLHAEADPRGQSVGQCSRKEDSTLCHHHRHQLMQAWGRSRSHSCHRLHTATAQGIRLGWGQQWKCTGSSIQHPLLRSSSHFMGCSSQEGSKRWKEGPTCHCHDCPQLSLPHHVATPYRPWVDQGRNSSGVPLMSRSVRASSLCLFSCLAPLLAQVLQPYLAPISAWSAGQCTASPVSKILGLPMVMWYEHTHTHPCFGSRYSWNIFKGLQVAIFINRPYLWKQLLPNSACIIERVLTNSFPSIKKG